jgi:hypothetical protein
MRRRLSSLSPVASSLLLAACATAPGGGGANSGGGSGPLPADAEARLAALEADLAATRAALAAAEARVGALEAAPPYTDADAVAAVQNDDPWGDPSGPNLQSLWSAWDVGYMQLDNGRWTWDNRAIPPGHSPTRELAELYHETPACGADRSFADCDTTAAMKIYVNGPDRETNDWSAAGWARMAAVPRHTHALGLYLVSFGRESTPSDWPYALIPPSGILLEPHGAHQALRIDGTGNTGDNVRIETTLGATGIAVYEGEIPGLYCDDLGRDCTRSYPLWLRGGRLHLEDLETERSAEDARGGGVFWTHGQTLGVEPFTTWHIDPALGVPAHCVYATRATARSLVRVQPHGAAAAWPEAHTYVVLESWGAGGAPPECTAAQLIFTEAAGVYGVDPGAARAAGPGFRVALLGGGPVAIDPAEFGEGAAPSFLFELIEPL